MKLYLIVDGATKKARLVQGKMRKGMAGPAPDNADPSKLKLKPTEAAFEINVAVPGLWGQVQWKSLEVTLPTPIEVGISASAVKDARHG